jgi:hypothetical protein
MKYTEIYAEVAKVVFVVALKQIYATIEYDDSG